MLWQSLILPAVRRHRSGLRKRFDTLPHELNEFCFASLGGANTASASTWRIPFAFRNSRRLFGTYSPSRNVTSLAKPPFRVLFAGADRFSCTSLELLAKQDKSLISELQVLVPPDKRTSRGLKEIRRPPLRTVAEELSLPILEVPENGLRDLVLPASFLKTAGPETSQIDPSNLLITVSFDYLIPQGMLKQFLPLNALNVHPSLLPTYRGAAPIQWAIMNGDEETGVTVQSLGLRFDEGHILSQERVAIAKDADYLQMEAYLASEGAQLLLETLVNLPVRQQNALPQDSSKVTLAHKLTTADAEVDFTSETSDTIMRRHLALSHQYPLWTMIKGKRVQLLAMSCANDMEGLEGEFTTPGMALLDKKKEGVLVRCKGGTWLRVTSLKTEGRKALRAQPWWLGVARNSHAFQM